GGLPRPLTKRIVARLLAAAQAGRRDRLEESLLRARRDAPEATEDALCEALADPARPAATAQLIGRPTWDPPRGPGALLEALPHAEGGGGSPRAGCRRDRVSPPVPPRPLAAAPSDEEETDARHRVLARLHPMLMLREGLRRRCELPLAALPFRAAVQATPHV